MTFDPGDDFPRPGEDASTFEFYAALDGALDKYYARQELEQPELMSFARQAADVYCEEFIEVLSDEYPSIGLQQELLHRGFVGLIAVTALENKETGEFDIPSATTFVDSMIVMFKYFEGDEARTIHEWSLLAMTAKVFAGSEDGFLFSHPDARLAHIVIGMAQKGFSRGLYGLDDQEV